MYENIHMYVQNYLLCVQNSATYDNKIFHLVLKFDVNFETLQQNKKKKRLFSVHTNTVITQRSSNNNKKWLLYLSAVPSPSSSSSRRQLLLLTLALPIERHWNRQQQAIAISSHILVILQRGCSTLLIFWPVPVDVQIHMYVHTLHTVW